MNSNMNLEVSNDMRLKGVVSIYVENTETGERKLWYEDYYVSSYCYCSFE